MRFIATSVIREPARVPEIATYHDAEAEVVWRLHSEGRLREVYFAPDRLVAFIILDAADRPAADAALAELPLSRSGILAWDVTELGPLPELTALLARRAIPVPAWWPTRNGPTA